MSAEEISRRDRPIRHLATFTGVLTVLSVPFWALGGLVESPENLPLRLPASALMVVCPAVVAVVVPNRRERRALFRPRRSAGRRVPSVAWACAVGVMPACLALTWLLIQVGGRVVPTQLPRPASLAVWTSFFALGAGLEELGWTAWLTDRLLAHWTVAQVGITIGVLWGAWHIVPYLQAGRDHRWIAGHVAVSVAMRILMVMLYEEAGHRTSVTVVFHTMANVAMASFPVAGSHYDPVVTAPITFAAGGVVFALLRRMSPLGLGRSSP